jgi:hypothetical protein
MKRHLLILLIICTTLQVKAQKWEVSLQGGTTFSHFTGSAATSNAGFVEGYKDGNQYYSINNSSGKKLAFGYSGGLQTQYVSKGGFIIGLGANYELLRSKVNINAVYPQVYYLMQALYLYGPPSYPATGSAYLSNRFITVSPYIGHRIKLKNSSLDLLPGIDMAFGLNSNESGTAADDNKTYKADVKNTKPLTDIRLKIGAAFNYRQFSLNAGYAHGILNYDRHYVGGTPKLYSELYRLGVGYRIN